MSSARSNTKIDYVCFGGAVETGNFSGSCHYLQIKRGKRKTAILIDCGIVHANFQDMIPKNLEILKYLTPEMLKEVDACVVTHIHADHAAGLPMLVSYGLECPVYCTKPSAILMPIALKNSAYIQQSESKYRKRRNKNSNFMPDIHGDIKYRRKEMAKANARINNDGVLYGFEEVDNTAELIKNSGFEYGEWIRLAKDIYLKFYPSGHVLGGAIVVIRVDDYKKNGEPLYIGFSGDLGSDDKLFLQPLIMPNEPLDIWFVESTYGGVEHPSKEMEIDRMTNLINRAFRESMKILNPNFALEKSQEMIFLFTHLAHEGVIEPIPAFLDAPLARSYTEAYAEFWQTEHFLGQKRIPYNPFKLRENPYFQIIEDPDASVMLSRREGPCFIIAGSGDGEAGRIRNHLRQNLSSPKTQVWKTGYAPADTLSGKLAAGFNSVRMNNREIEVNAEIHLFDGLSSHRDGKNIAIMASRMFNSGNRKGLIALVHGDEVRARSLKKDMVDLMGQYWKNHKIIFYPKKNELFTLQLA